MTHADFISLENSSEKDSKRLLFYHRNAEETVFDVAVAQQGMNEVKSQMMNPLKNLTFGGYLSGENLEYIGTSDSVYAGTDYRAWGFRSLKASKKHHFSVVLHTEQTETVTQWEQGLKTAWQRIAPQGKISSKVVSQDKNKPAYGGMLSGNGVLSKRLVKPKTRRTAK